MKLWISRQLSGLFRRGIGQSPRLSALDQQINDSTTYTTHKDEGRKSVRNLHTYMVSPPTGIFCLESTLWEPHVTAVRNIPLAVQIIKQVKCYTGLAIRKIRSLCSPWRIWWVYICSSIINFSSRGEWSAPQPRLSTRGPTGTHWTGGGWAPEQVWQFRRRDKSIVSCTTFRPMAYSPYKTTLARL